MAARIVAGGRLDAARPAREEDWRRHSDRNAVAESGRRVDRTSTVFPVSVPLSGAAAKSWRSATRARREPGVPVTHETLFPLASVTKPIAAATFMTLVDDGIVSLDEPVGRLVPEFRAGPAPVRKVSIRS